MSIVSFLFREEAFFSCWMPWPGVAEGVEVMGRLLILALGAFDIRLSGCFLFLLLHPSSSISGFPLGFGGTKDIQLE